MNNKKGMEMEYLIWWIIGIAVLVVAIGGFLILKSRGLSAGEYIKNLLRFGS